MLLILLNWQCFYSAFDRSKRNVQTSHTFFIFFRDYEQSAKKFSILHLIALNFHYMMKYRKLLGLIINTSSVFTSIWPPPFPCSKPDLKKFFFHASAYPAYLSPIHTALSSSSTTALEAQKEKIYHAINYSLRCSHCFHLSSHWLTMLERKS